MYINIPDSMHVLG